MIPSLQNNDWRWLEQNFRVWESNVAIVGKRIWSFRLLRAGNRISNMNCVIKPLPLSKGSRSLYWWEDASRREVKRECVPRQRTCSAPCCKVPGKGHGLGASWDVSETFASGLGASRDISKLSLVGPAFWGATRPPSQLHHSNCDAKSLCKFYE